MDLINQMVNYFGVDWLAMIMGYGGTYLLGNRKRSGFILFMISALCWIAVGFIAHSSAMILGNIIFFAMNFRSFATWLKRSKEKPGLSS